jgi:hypothetical protein
MRAHDKMLRLQVNERFLVTSTTDDTLDDEHLVLRNAKALQAGEWVPVDGEIWLPRFSIAYMQKP